MTQLNPENATELEKLQNNINYYDIINNKTYEFFRKNLKHGMLKNKIIDETDDRELRELVRNFSELLILFNNSDKEENIWCLLSNKEGFLDECENIAEHFNTTFFLSDNSPFLIEDIDSFFEINFKLIMIKMEISYIEYIMKWDKKQYVSMDRGILSIIQRIDLFITTIKDNTKKNEYKSKIDHIKFQWSSDVARYTIYGREPNIFNILLNESKKIGGERIKLKEELKTIEDIERRLDNLKKGVNFVELSKAFGKLLKDKQEKIKGTEKQLYGMGTLIVIILALEIYNVNEFAGNWLTTLPILGLEFILLYFFRIILNEYKSIQAQILQLELRQSLCAFIQDYITQKQNKDATHKNGNGENVTVQDDAWKKFEDLIFSNILADTKQMPSTFDGIDSIAKLIQSVKNK